MAKKRLNLRSTMTKNKDTELPKKIELKRSTKNIDEVKEKVEAIHIEEQAIPKPTSPPTKSKARKSKKTLTTDKDEIVRITIDLPKDLHKKLKIHAVMNEITIRNYVVSLLQKSLK